MYYKEWEDRPLTSNFKPLQDSLCVLAFSATIIILRYKYLDNLVTRFYDICHISDQDKRKERSKLLGSTVRLVMYIMFALYGIFTLLSEDWIFSPFKTSLTWEKNNIPAKITVYYYLEAAFYVSSTFFIFVDPKQKDFMQMLVHHLITITLISLSYGRNILRYGTVIMLVHDISDPFMECAKVLFYLKYMKMSYVLFFCFAGVFTFFRCIIFPFFIVFPAVTYTWLYGLNGTFVICDSCMILLVILNFIWLSYILQMVYNFLKEGSLKGDVRDLNDDRKTK